MKCCDVAAVLVWVVLSLSLSLAPAALGQVTYLARPAEGEFVADGAALLAPQDRAAIVATSSKLLAEQGVPLWVVTINSLADYGAAGWPIERYAMNLFAEWGIGRASRNSGILLLVSKGDRKVRVELGAAWSRERDAAAAAAEVRRRGFEAFHLFRVGHTGGRNGFLIYVSLLERMDWVCGDDAVNAKLPQATWESAGRAIADGFARGRPEAGLVEAVSLCGRALAEAFPRREGDAEELPNTLRIMD